MLKIYLVLLASYVLGIFISLFTAGPDGISFAAWVVLAVIWLAFSGGIFVGRIFRDVK